MPNRKILVVEDEFLIRLTLVESLADDGFAAVEAATSDEALALLRDDDDIELLLTDVQLPGALDGVGLARAARRLRPLLPVVFMTGLPGNLPDFGHPGRDAWVAKPYLPSEISAVVRRLLKL